MPLETNNTSKSRHEVHTELLLHLEIQLNKWHRETETSNIPYAKLITWASDWLRLNTQLEYRTRLSHIELATQRLVHSNDWYELGRMIYAMKKQIRLERPNPNESEKSKVLV